jgi:hypothetical protein
MSTSSVSSSRAHAISPEAIAAWNDLTVSAADGRVRVLAIETGRTTALHTASPGLGGPSPTATRPLLAANDAPIEQAAKAATGTETRAESQPAADATALLDFALALCEQSESASPLNAAPEAEKPDAPTSLSLATQPQGEPHAGI